jgi:hypothetical protein
MRKFIFIICFLAAGLYSFSQMDKAYAKIEITSVFINEHRSSIDTSIKIVLEKFGHTDIISLGTIDTTEVGFQLEILKSNLGEKEIMLNGMAFFTKKNGKWEMYSNPVYFSSNCKTISDKSFISEEDAGHASSSIKDIQIDYKQWYYIIK